MFIEAFILVQSNSKSSIIEINMNINVLYYTLLLITILDYNIKLYNIR